jgi:hypothetical protein
MTKRRSQHWYGKHDKDGFIHRSWKPTPPHYTRGYARLYIDHVLQADRGADLDFLVGKDTRLVTRESH